MITPIKKNHRNLSLLLSLTLYTSLASAQEDPKLTSYRNDLRGYYVFTGMAFSKPFDLNRDGKIGLTWAQEMDKCARDQQFEFFEDGSGKMYWGQLEKNCQRKGQEAFKWSIRSRKHKTETGTVVKYYLVLGDQMSGSTFEIMSLNGSAIVLKGEFPDGLDSTYEGEMHLRRKKKKS